jgi:hypothetical protein
LSAPALSIAVAALLAQPPWEQALLPPEVGRMEARAGPVLNYGDGAVSPGAVFNYRMTVSRRVSFGAPLYVSVVAIDGGPVWLSFSGGITNLFSGGASFLLPVWMAHVEGYARGGSTVARVRAGVFGRVPGGIWAELEGAVLQRLTERVSFGLAVEAQWQLSPVVATGATFNAGAWAWPKTGPTVRVWLLGDWSLDLLAQVSTGAPSLVAGAAVVWAPKILP